MFAALKLLAACLVLGIPTALVGIPMALVTRDIERAYGWGMKVSRGVLRSVNIRVEPEWRSPLDPATKYLFFSNHLSNLDPPVLIPLLPGRTTVFLKQGLMWIPLLGYAMKLAGFIPVGRDGTVESAKRSVDLAACEMANGVHVTSFIEGTRSPDGRLLPFKNGPFFLAMETGAPIVPVTIRGTEKVMRKGSLRVHPGPVRVIFHAPIHPGDYATREDLMDAVRAVMEATLRES